VTERVAIVGSRTYPHEADVRECVRGLPNGTTIVTGGARGPDTWAVDEARALSLERTDGRSAFDGMHVVVFEADWERHGKAAGVMRNTQIVDHCDRVIAFHDGVSRGTADMIKKARAAGKPVEVVLSRSIA
jgi:hypothetical protein